jgi:hypothetical protein
MKNTFLLLLLSGSLVTTAQQHITRAGHVHFFSSTPLEDIEAATHQMSAILDLSNGSSAGFAFQVPILSFHFEKALMEEHFNENYLESERFPRSTFEGTIENWADLPDNEEWNDVIASGTFTLHGISKGKPENRGILGKSEPPLTCSLQTMRSRFPNWFKNRSRNRSRLLLMRN